MNMVRQTQRRPQASGLRRWLRWLFALNVMLVAPWAAPQNETPIKAGDTLFIDVYRRPELSSTIQVDASGNVSVPYVGSVNVAEVSEKEASARVSSALTSVLKNPRVTVSRTAPSAAAFGRAAEMKTQVLNLKNANAKVLCTSLEGMSSKGGHVGFDPNSNSVIITDTPVAIQNMMGVITQIDQMQTQVVQVRIQTKVAEVEQGAMKQLGIRWFGKGNDVTGGMYPPPLTQNPLSGQSGASANEQVGGASGSSSSGGTGRTFVDGLKFDRLLNVPVQVPTPGQMFFGLLRNNVDIGAMVDALVKDNKAELLATPMILAVNHKQAEIKMTDEFPYTESSQSFGGTSFSVKFMDLGIKMMVTPHVYRDASGAYVQLDLNPEVSFSSGMSNGVPVRSVRSSNTVANVRDGQTLVIGGIILSDERNVVQQVPGIGKIPLIGNLFKRKERARTRNELMVFVTPTIHEEPESITWDKMINLTGAAKNDLKNMPTNETVGEARKE